MLWYSAEKQPSFFIEFFNSIGTQETPSREIWASALAHLLLLVAAKSKVKNLSLPGQKISPKETLKTAAWASEIGTLQTFVT